MPKQELEMTLNVQEPEHKPPSKPKTLKVKPVEKNIPTKDYTC